MSQVTTHIDEEAIRAKAYELWQLRGCPEGDPGDDWLRAERLLLEEAAERQHREMDAASSGPAEIARSYDDETTLPSGMPVPAPEAPDPPKAAKRRGSRRR
jgi:hypothetical protein